MLTCKIGENYINTFEYNNEQIRVWSNKGILKCPACNGKMIYRNGEFKIAHFAHEKNECSVFYVEPETFEHLNGKKTLYNWLKNQKGITNLILEAWLPETKQRPDIYFEYNGQKYVIEYQCSPIATKYTERHRLYMLAGIEDIWILGTKKYNIFRKYDKYKTKTIEREILFKNKRNLIYFDLKYGYFYLLNKNNVKMYKDRTTIFNIKNRIIKKIDKSNINDIFYKCNEYDFWNNSKIFINTLLSKNIQDYHEYYVKSKIIFRYNQKKYIFFINNGYVLRQNIKYINKYNIDGVNVIQLFDYNLYKNFFRSSQIYSNYLQEGNYIDFKNNKVYIVVKENNQKYITNKDYSGWYDVLKFKKISLENMNFENFVIEKGNKKVYSYNLNIFDLTNNNIKHKYKIINYKNDEDKLCNEILYQCRQLSKRGVCDFYFGIKFSYWYSIEYLLTILNSYGFNRIKILESRNERL